MFRIQGKPIKYFGHSHDTQIGDSVVVSHSSIDIILTSKRGQPRRPNIFTLFGIDPEKKRVLVLKGMHHFRHYFGEIADEMFNIVGGGLLNPNFTEIPYQRITRPKWPFDENPFE